jgi:hypothetical protein
MGRPAATGCAEAIGAFKIAGIVPSGVDNTGLVHVEVVSRSKIAVDLEMPMPLAATTMFFTIDTDLAIIWLMSLQHFPS